MIVPYDITWILTEILQQLKHFFPTQQDEDLKVAAVAAFGKARRLLPFIRKVRCSASV